MILNHNYFFVYCIPKLKLHIKGCLNFMDFETLEKLYQQICLNHVDRLFNLYNSDANPANTKPNTKRIQIEFNPQDINNAQAESKEIDTIIIYRGLLKRLHTATQRLIEHRYSSLNVEERQIIAVFIFSVATHFVISHEFAHLYCGHCDFLNVINNKNIPLNFSVSSKIGINYLDYQTLEMNADALAMCRTIDFVLYKPYHNKAVIKLIHDKCISIDLLLCAMNITFFVLRNFMPPIFDVHFADQKHHPAFLRQIMNSQTFKKYLEEEHNIKISETTIDEHFASDEKLLCELFYIPPIADHYKNNLNEVFIEHEQKLRTNWNRIYDRLTPFSRTLLPPKFNL